MTVGDRAGFARVLLVHLAAPLPDKLHACVRLHDPHKRVETVSPVPVPHQYLTVGAMDGNVLVWVLAPEGAGDALHLINGLPGGQHLHRPDGEASADGEKLS